MRPQRSYCAALAGLKKIDRSGGLEFGSACLRGGQASTWHTLLCIARVQFGMYRWWREKCSTRHCR